MQSKITLNKRIIEFSIVFLMGISIAFLSEHIQWQSATAQQTLVPEAVASQIYEQITDLPKENQYINKERQQADPNNTLLSRFVRYHQYVKNRPVDFRLDWKLTLADYFGLNEDIQEINYPGVSTLTLSPLEGDRQTINQLNRQQRNKLVDLLVSIYNPNAAAIPQPSINSTTQTPSQSTPTNTKPTLPLPKPGDANLLK
jgi:hypothetical protein